jgi:lipoprotein-releasing system ATP-binding protein
VKCCIMNKDEMNNETVVEIKGVDKTFRNGEEKLIILNGLDLSVPREKIVSISGESGSGKSTLLNIIGGLDKPSGGTVRVKGKRIDNLPEENLTDFRKHTVGFIFQFHFLLKDFTALENVLLPGYIAGMPKNKAEARGRFLLEQVFLGERYSHYPAQLSGGERQRVAVARALMNGPEIILADEPTGNLDEANSRNVEEILFSLVAKLNTTLVLVTHDMDLAGRGTDHYRLQNGTVERIE